MSNEQDDTQQLRFNKALAKLQYAEQRNIKARNIRICRNHIYHAKNILELSEKSPTLKYWRHTLSGWITLQDNEVRIR